MNPPLQLTAHARRIGPAPTERITGNPLEPSEPVAHEAWFIGGAEHSAGALRLDDTLHLAVGPAGAGWRLVDGRAEPLTFETDRPAALAGADAEHPPHEAARRAPLVTLRWCTVRPALGDRFLLHDGLSLEPSQLDLTAANESLLDAVPEAPSPGFFARLFGARPAAGVALVLEATEGAPEPEGWLPWLRFHQERKREFHCWGTEGGGELELHHGPCPEDVTEALLEVLRTHPALEPEHFRDLYANWQEFGAAPEVTLTDLVSGAPERGGWQPLELDDLADIFLADAGRTTPEGLRVDAFLPGLALVERLRATVDEPVALALHTEPIEQPVVTWFIAGGRAKASGDLECLLSERVWS